jgi:hypothetical protein
LSTHHRPSGAKNEKREVEKSWRAKISPVDSFTG